MKPQYRTELRNHWIKLVKGILDPEQVACVLLTENILSQEEYDQIFEDRSLYKYNNGLLLYYLEDKNDAAYIRFVNILDEIGLNDLYKLFHLSKEKHHVLGASSKVFKQPSDVVDEVDKGLEDLSLDLDQADILKTCKDSTLPPLTIKVILGERILGNEDDVYVTKSKNRGHVLIINNKFFNERKTRNGSEIDLQNLTEVFEQMGLRVDKHEEKTVEEIKDIVQKFLEFDPKNIYDVYIVIVMSHGDHIGGKQLIYDKNNDTLTTDWIEKRFNNKRCEMLRGIPKMFFYQFCRGKVRDLALISEIRRRGMVESNSEIDSGELPKITRRVDDMLIVYSTQKGYVSNRDPTFGSWFFRVLCETFMNDAHNTELSTMLGRADRKIKSFIDLDGGMQTPQVESIGFNKHFYFNPGIYEENGELKYFSLD